VPLSHQLLARGAPKYVHKSFAVVEVNAERMKVAAYDYLARSWQWWHEKPLRAAAAPDVVGVRPVAPGEHRAEMQLDRPRSVAGQEAADVARSTPGPAPTPAVSIRGPAERRVAP
jgi:hypothetical protein